MSDLESDIPSIFAAGEYELPVRLDDSTIDEFSAAQILEISVDELRRMRAESTGPAHVAVVRDIVRYYPDVVFAYGDAVVNQDRYFPHGF